MGHKIKNTVNNPKKGQQSQKGPKLSIFVKANLVLSEFILRNDGLILGNDSNSNQCYLICDQFGFTKMNDLLPIFKRNKISFYIKYNEEFGKCMLVLFYM